MAIINLFGASGHAKVIMDIIHAQGDHVNFLYDDAPHCINIHGIQVFKASDVEIQGPIIISIGSNRARKKIAERLPLDFATAIHPRSIVSPTAKIGSGSVVMQGAIIQADSIIGSHCIINTGASIDHECIISDYVHVSPHATLCGNVHIGEGSSIGAGSVIKQGITIGSNSIIGAGSVVVNDIPDNVVAFGNPCKIHRVND